tara:strand:- start:46 stop:948 length:903 start_codon:yes stop_codon:yes gene_type:complete
MNFNVFENLDFSNIKDLYNLILENKDNLFSVKNLYLRNNRDLQETLNFIIDLNLIEVEGNKILIKENSDNLKDLLIKKILEKPKYFLVFKSYLNNFVSDGNIIKFKSNPGFNILTSSLRNLLITMKIVHHDISQNTYQLIDTYLINQINNIEYSPEQLENELLRQKQIGFEAEKLVFLREIIDVKKINKDLKVEHISIRDVSAGFDIKSFKKIENKVREIYIEVKAVSSSNYKFHLSLGEYQKAKQNSENYYLYLLPVDYSHKDRFNYDQILKINNIEKNIFENKINWNYQNDGFLVFKN